MCTCVCTHTHLCLLSPVWLFVTHKLYPTRLLCPWNCSSKNTGVGCHFLLQGIFPTQGSNLGLLHRELRVLATGPPRKSLNDFRCVLVPQLCPTLCDPMDCSPQGSSVHGILEARILEWVSVPFSRGSSQLRGSNLGLSHCRQIPYHLSHQGSPLLL